MARIPRLRGAGGRFLRRDAPEEEVLSVEIYDTLGGGRLESITPSEYFHPEEPEPEREPFWESETTDRAIVWRNFDPDADQSLEAFAPPEGVDMFRVFVEADTESTDARNRAGTIWLGMDRWPPTPGMVGRGGAESFEMIVFRQARGHVGS